MVNEMVDDADNSEDIIDQEEEENNMDSDVDSFIILELVIDIQYDDQNGCIVILPGKLSWRKIHLLGVIKDIS